MCFSCSLQKYLLAFTFFSSHRFKVFIYLHFKIYLFKQQISTAYREYSYIWLQTRMGENQEAWFQKVALIAPLWEPFGLGRGTNYISTC